MKEWIGRKSVIGGIIAGTVGIFVALALSLTLVFDGEANGAGEPLDAATKAVYQGGHLKFIAETGRIVVNENGLRQIVWDPPELPTLEESITKTTQAKEANDRSLLPLCTQEYIEHLKAQRASEGSGASAPSGPRSPSFPVCNAIPDTIGLGAPGGPAQASSHGHHAGYYYNGDSASDGINGAITRDDPSLNQGEFVSSRLLVDRTVGGVRYWIEGGWAEYYDTFLNHDQNVYVQQCDSTQDECYWNSFEHACGDDDNTLIYIASDSENKWDAHCYNFDIEEWHSMWLDYPLGNADTLEALFETNEEQSGTISMGTVRFYGLELYDGSDWPDWEDEHYGDDTHLLDEGGYSVTVNSSYEDYEVDN